MYRIDSTEGASGTEPTRPVPALQGHFLASARTKIADWWLSMIQNEIINVLVRAGIVPAKGSSSVDDVQLANAIEALAVSNAVTQITKYRNPYWVWHYEGTRAQLPTWQSGGWFTKPTTRVSNIFTNIGNIGWTGIPLSNRGGSCFTMSVVSTASKVWKFKAIADDYWFMYINNVQVASGAGGVWTDHSITIPAGLAKIQFISYDNNQGSAFFELDVAGDSAPLVDFTNTFFVETTSF